MQTMEDRMEDVSCHHRISLKMLKRDESRKFNVIDDECNIDNTELFKDWNEDYSLKDIKDKIRSLISNSEIKLIRRRTKKFLEFSSLENDILNKTNIDSDYWDLIMTRIYNKNWKLLTEDRWSGKVRYQVVIYHLPFPDKIKPNILYACEIEYRLTAGWVWDNDRVTDIAAYYCKFVIYGGPCHSLSFMESSSDSENYMDTQST